MPTESIMKDLRAKGRASFFIYRQSLNELTADKEDALPYFLAEKKYLLNGATDVSGLESRRSAIIQGLRQLHIVALYRVVVRQWVDHGLLLARAAQSNDAPPDGPALFLTHLQAMVTKSESENGVAADLLQAGMAHIPLRMATIKYKQYVTDAIEATIGNDFSEKDAEALKRFFNPMHFLEGEEWLADIKAPLDEIWRKDCTAMTEADGRKFEEASREVSQKISFTLNDLSNLYDAYCSAIIVAEEKPEISEEERNLTMSQLDDVIDDEFLEIEYAADDDDLPDDARWKRVHELFYSTALDYFGVRDRHAEKEPRDFNGFLAGLLPFLNCEGLAPNRKRFLRQQFLGFLTYPYPLETYRNYFIDTYEALDDVNRRYLAEYVKTQEVN